MGTLQRRDFLRMAVLGAAGAAVSAGRANAAPGNSGGRAPAPGDVDVVEGVLLGVGRTDIELGLPEGVQTFAWNQGTSAWRGGEVAIHTLVPGEDVMVRFDSDRTIQRSWSNLSRFQGQILRSVSGGYRIRTLRGDFASAELEIRLAPGAEIEVPLRGRATGVALPDGALVDVIGLRGPGEFVATLVSHLLPVDDRDIAGPQDVVVERDGLIVTASYSGYATWFNCSNGAGACGSCKTSNSAQCAWPSIGTGCRFSGSCKNQKVLSCGSSVSFKDTCSGKSRTLHVADCGPNENELCSRTCTRCGTVKTPFIDLTKPTFAYFDDPAQHGCFSCSVTV